MQEIFSSPERSTCLNRGDKRLMWALTLIYTVFTLLNLGTLSFPTSVWTSQDAASVCIDLGAEYDVAEIWTNGNIAEGTAVFTGDDGSTAEYTQKYAAMFTWRVQTAAMHTRYVTFQCIAGNVSLNEIAFFDGAGNRLPALIAAGTAGGTALLDEQDTVPNEPSYLNGMYFDEIYHARTAYEFLHTMSVYEWTHPPLGKILIMLGVAIFGMKPFGWRVVPALFGAAMLPVFFTLAKRLFRRRDLAFLAAALLALDTMHYTQTRIATVDVFILFFILLMVLFMTDYIQTDYMKAPLKTLFFPLGACGVSFGLGVASKWTGLYAGAGLAVMFFAHMIRVGVSCRGNSAERKIFWRRTWATVGFCCIFFLAIPALIYYLSYIPFFSYEATKPSGIGSLALIFQQQESMYRYHHDLTATHTCQSAWYEWPFTSRSVWFYFRSLGENRVSDISSTGSPAVWWVSAIGAILLAVEALFRRTKRENTHWKQAGYILLIAIAANYLPWTLVPRCTFQYHFFTTFPFVVLAAILFLQHLEESGEISGKIQWIWLAVAAAYFILLYPAASGLPMPRLYAQFLEYVLPCGQLFFGAV